jgi:hypothetical protein
MSEFLGSAENARVAVWSCRGVPICLRYSSMGYKTHFECFHKLLTQNYYNVTLGMGAKYV